MGDLFSGDPSSVKRKDPYDTALRHIQEAYAQTNPEVAKHLHAEQQVREQSPYALSKHLTLRLPPNDPLVLEAKRKIINGEL